MKFCLFLATICAFSVGLASLRHNNDTEFTGMMASTLTRY